MNNPPAFPHSFIVKPGNVDPFTQEKALVDTEHVFSGMTLRDYFAAKALQMIVVNDVSGRPENFREHYSEGAYQWADAMLAAREKGQPK